MAHAGVRRICRTSAGPAYLRHDGGWVGERLGGLPWPLRGCSQHGMLCPRADLPAAARNAEGVARAVDKSDTDILIAVGGRGGSFSTRMAAFSHRTATN
jgi:hypothetical protein